MIPAEEYARIIEVLPILCVDVVIRSPRGEYLLIKRANGPRRGEWWVTGGRVHKGETLEQAAVRKVKEEVSLSVKRMHALGYYEATSQENPFGQTGRLHAVSVVFVADVDDAKEITLDQQSTDWKYSGALPGEFVIRSFCKTNSTVK